MKSVLKSVFIWGVQSWIYLLVFIDTTDLEHK